LSGSSQKIAPPANLPAGLCVLVGETPVARLRGKSAALGFYDGLTPFVATSKIPGSPYLFQPGIGRVWFEE
jgi:hypothetical protein